MNSCSPSGNSRKYGHSDGHQSEVVLATKSISALARADMKQRSPSNGRLN